MEKLYKKVLLAMMAIIMAVSFTACGDDDEPAAPTTGNIVGTWESVERKYVGQTNETTITTTYNFNAGGTGYFQEVEKVITGAENKTYSTFSYTIATATNGVMTVKTINDENKVSKTLTVTQTGNTLIIDGDLFKRK